MKKSTLYLVLFLISLLFFTSCKSNSLLINPINGSETDISSSERVNSQKTTENLSIVEANPEIHSDNNNQGGAIIEARKYRVRYYSIPGAFADLVGREECHRWENENGQNIISSEKMLIAYFVKDFNITKENFEKANLQFAKSMSKTNRMMMNPLDYTNQEIYEVFNADIIYTFDDEIINEYYLSHDYPYLYEREYEEALEAGTYQTRTTDWIDIEEMEAEIIAKYGEAEIVTTDYAEAEVPPYILSLTVNDIRKIKSAAETMTEEDFLRYMDENYIDEAMNGLDSRENAEKIFDELEDRYVIVYNEKDMGKILTCYIESGYLHQRIFLDENQYLNIRLYADEESAWQCEDGEKFKLLKTYSHENAEFEVMESFEENGKQYLCVNVIIGEQRMNFFTGEEMSLEEFEKVLSDIEIVKIGDLLDDPEFSTEG